MSDFRMYLHKTLRHSILWDLGNPEWKLTRNV